MFYFQRPVGGLERTLKICTTWYKSSASAPDPAWPDGELAGPGENAEDLYHVVQIFSVRAGPGPELCRISFIKTNLWKFP
jgi:hypothetical protein